MVSCGIHPTSRRNILLLNEKQLFFLSRLSVCEPQSRLNDWTNSVPINILATKIVNFTGPHNHKIAIFSKMTIDSFLVPSGK
jgi:hypothetical protein